jgi:hypothetical protein
MTNILAKALDSWLLMEWREGREFEAGGGRCWRAFCRYWAECALYIVGEVGEVEELLGGVGKGGRVSVVAEFIVRCSE